MSKKASGILVAVILAVTGLIWLLVKRDLVLWIGLAILAAVIAGDMFLELKKNAPRSIRGTIQAVICCLGGGVVVVLILAFLCKGVI